jgi:hypothetical protein
LVISAKARSMRLSILLKQSAKTQVPTCDAIYGVIVSLTTIVLALWGTLFTNHPTELYQWSTLQCTSHTMHECCRGGIHDIREKRAGRRAEHLEPSNVTSHSREYRCCSLCSRRVVSKLRSFGTRTPARWASRDNIMISFA